MLLSEALWWALFGTSTALHFVSSWKQTLVSCVRVEHATIRLHTLAPSHPSLDDCLLTLHASLIDCLLSSHLSLVDCLLTLHSISN